MSELERLREGCKELGLDVKGDGTDAQMVETVLGMIGRRQRVESRLCERLSEFHQAAQAVLEAFDQISLRRAQHQALDAAMARLRDLLPSRIPQGDV